MKMIMSFAEAVEYINPAYNTNVDSFFPQPVLNSTPSIADSSVTSSNEGSLTVAPERFTCNNTTNQKHAVELCKKKTVEVLQCEICSVSCNSILVLEKHMMGKKHRKKTGEQNPEALMLDSLKSDECMEGVEKKIVKHIDKDAIPGPALEEMSTTTHISCGPCETQTMLPLEPLGKCSDVVSEIPIPKHQGFSTSVVDNTCNKKDVDDDEIMANKRQSTQLKPGNSSDLSHLDSASVSRISSFRVCTLCNICSNSQAELEKHIAGKTHARKVKHLGTVMPSPVTVYPRTESHTLKLTGDTSTQEDPASFVPIGCSKIQEPIHSESGNVISSPKVCTTCSIKCNSQENLQNHLYGRKHASKVHMLGSSIHTPSTKDQGATGRASKRGMVVQFAYCDVCKIHCNSSEILGAHIMGKKHMKQLEKLGK